VGRSQRAARCHVRRDVLLLRRLAMHQYWLVLFGYGLLGGIGWCIRYISPVSTLIKWFPDKPGMATESVVSDSSEFAAGSPAAI